MRSYEEFLQRFGPTVAALFSAGAETPQARPAPPGAIPDTDQTPDPWWMPSNQVRGVQVRPTAPPDPGFAVPPPNVYSPYGNRGDYIPLTQQPVVGPPAQEPPRIFEDGSVDLGTNPGNAWAVIRGPQGQLLAMPVAYATNKPSDEWMAIGVYADPKTVGQLMTDPASLFKQAPDVQAAWGYTPPVLGPSKPNRGQYY